jgi:SAM-dependent methyltransferase
VTDTLLNDIFEWDVVNWSRHMDVWKEAIAQKSRRSGLEIGARGGGLSLWMALHGLDVVCSYFDEDMTRARALHDAYGVSARVSYEALNILELAYQDRFDVVMLKSVLGGIGGTGAFHLQQLAIKRIYAALRTGGVFLFAENVVATRLHAMLRAVKRGRSWRYLSLPEIEALMTPYPDLSYRTTGVVGLFGPSEAQRRALGYVDTYLSQLVPQTWCYICVGAAFK